ncbi:MAG: alpha/beta fold hydrolase [Burkholderiales bacterium]
MPRMNVRGVSLHYKIIGESGAWVALSPGGHRSMDHVETLAQKIAASGYRVLIHDRRNCGLSDMAFDDTQSEFDTWADDLHAMMTQLNALPAYIGGSSSGCRLSLKFALKYPQAVKALLLWRVTGGQFAVNRLSNEYYGKYLLAAEQGGMGQVCNTDHYLEQCHLRPENRAVLMATDAKKFINTMNVWRKAFLESAQAPVIGATEAQLKTIKHPTCIVPGNDNTHPLRVGEHLHRILGECSELHVMYPEHQDVDLIPGEQWVPREGEMAAIFTDFLNRIEARSGV